MDKLEILRRKGSSIEETLAYFYAKKDARYAEAL